MPWLERALERMPIIENSGIKRIVNGAIPHSADGPPLLGPVAGLKNFWLCCGSSFGIAQGAGCGKYLAQWMLHGDAEINMTGFDPRRFGAFADESYMKDKGRQDYSMTYFTPLPGEELPAARPRRTSPLYEKLEARGCVYTETFGWERPKWFSLDGREEEYGYRRNNVFDVVRDECLAVRERAGILDLSGFAKYDVTGAGARAFLDRVCANRMPDAGGIVLAHLLSEGGRIGAEMTVTHLADDHFYVLSAAGAELRDLDHLVQGRHAGEQAQITNVTDERGVLVLAGPAARDILARLTDAPLDSGSFRWLSGREISIAGRPVRALRVNYVGELGWELHPPMEHMEELYDALQEAGAAFGLTDFGLYAVNSLRLEKGVPGLGRGTDQRSHHDRCGHGAFSQAGQGRLYRQTGHPGATGQELPLDRQTALQLVYFEVDATDSDVRGSEPLYHGGACVGVTTSGGYGHYVRQSLGFGYVPPALAQPGTELGVGLLGERRPARVLKDPAYDPRQ